MRAKEILLWGTKTWGSREIQDVSVTYNLKMASSSRKKTKTRMPPVHLLAAISIRNVSNRASDSEYSWKFMK
jgi:hypothetical protein